MSKDLEYSRVKVIKRKRNRNPRKGCSQSVKLSLAEYSISNSKSAIELLDFIEKNNFVSGVVSGIYADRTIACLYDGSFIGFFDDGSCRLLDAMGRFTSAMNSRYRQVGVYEWSTIQL